MPCVAGAPEPPLVLPWVPAADVCALAAKGDAANPTARSTAIVRLVLVMANPFGRGLSVASAVRSSNHSCTEQSYNSTRAKMCRKTITMQGLTLHHDGATSSSSRAGAHSRRLGSPPHRDASSAHRQRQASSWLRVFRSSSRNGALTGILSLVTVRTDAKHRPAPHIRME